MTPDAGRVCAHAFQAIGDLDLSDPEPNSIMVFLNDDHPPIPERMQFCLNYDPWSKGRQGEFVP